MERSSRLALAAVLLAEAALLVAVGLELPLMDPDEARFARTTVEMLRSGDLVVPTFEGAPRLAKPPLLHWIQCAVFRAFGPGELAARVPSILATLGSILIAAWIARLRFGEEGAAWTAASLATLPLVVFQGTIGTIDALLALHVLGAVALDIVDPEAGSTGRSVAIGAILGLAFLAKGPVGVLLPLLVILAGRTVTGREVLPGPARLAWGAVGCCAVALPWGLALIARLGSSPVLSTLRNEALARYFAPVSHPEPPWYYVALAPVMFFPWVVPAAAGAVRSLARRRDPSARTAAYASAGLLAGLAFLSLGRGKLLSYALPLTPLVAIVVAWEIGSTAVKPRARRRTAWGTIATLALGAVVCGGLALAGYEPQFGVLLWASAAILAAGALVAAIAVRAGRIRTAYGVIAAAAFAFLLVGFAGAAPAVGRSRSAAGLVESVTVLRGGRPVVVLERRLPSLTYYLDRVVATGSGSDALHLARGPDRPLLVIDLRDVRALPSGWEGELREVGRSGRFLVLETASNGGGPKADANPRAPRVLDGPNPPL